MTRPHSPWPLFTDDLDMARSWLRPQLQDYVSARTGHLAINLGMSDSLLSGLHYGAIQADADALLQWRFRVARLRGETNPYVHLLPDGLFEHAQAAIAHSKTTGDPLGVMLNGGIGDHLEALGLLLPWAEAKNCCLDLVMDPERQKLIEPLLPAWEGIRCNKAHDQGAALIPVMAMRGAVLSSDETAHYRSWLLPKQSNQTRKQQWLCCWRAEGVGDKLSAHSRSVPWALVREFYCHLQRVQPQAEILDITHWTDWETKHLRSIGVQILNPRQGTLLDLAKLCRVSHVVTIDTALVHICASAGQRAELLLSLFPDERWKELHRPEHNYGELIKLWRSSQFGSWSTLLSSFATSVTEALG